MSEANESMRALLELAVALASAAPEELLPIGKISSRTNQSEDGELSGGEMSDLRRRHGVQRGKPRQSADPAMP